MSGGYQHCFLSTAARAYCWGAHSNAPYYLATPTLVSDEAMTSIGADEYLMTASGELRGIVATSGGGWHFFVADVGGLTLRQLSGQCGIATDGKAYCFDRPPSTASPTIRLVAGQ